MPELPEVEIVVRRLREDLVGREIQAVRVPSKLVLREISKARARDLLEGARITGVRRRAKHILIETDRETLVVHLRMTGDLNLVSSDEPLPKFTRLAIDVDGGTLAFTDRRHLGTAHVVKDANELLRELGPEPLDDAFDADALAARLKGARPIKASLLDRKVIAGVGNIYSDESLFRARIAPMRKTSSLKHAEIVKLHEAIRAALTDSIKALQGKKIAWRYLDRTSESPFLVYDRGGEPCLRCGTPLAVLRVAGRTTVACPKCQSFKAPKRKAKRRVSKA